MTDFLQLEKVPHLDFPQFGNGLIGGSNYVRILHKLIYTLVEVISDMTETWCKSKSHTISLDNQGYIIICICSNDLLASVGGHCHLCQSNSPRQGAISSMYLSLYLLIDLGG